MADLYLYVVGPWECESLVPFGPVWEEAQRQAEAFHCAIYRWKFKGDTEEEEVFFKGGVFLPVRYAEGEEDRIKIF